MPNYYITTPIYYVNDVASIGHAYTTIAADVLARWHRLKGDRTFFLTGLDENSKKTTDAALKAGLSDAQRYTDDMAATWMATWKRLNISHDRFLRTTEETHKKKVQEVLQKIYDAGDIYKAQYHGLYCDGCENFMTEGELVEGKCPLHKKEPTTISEENYFFRLTKYADRILEHIAKNPRFILPLFRKNEMVSFIKEGLKDVSFSRQNLDWGIPLPWDPTQKTWVWADALINYLTGAEGGWWPADAHLLAKDILRFHCVIWPAMLLSAGYELPKQIVVHGFLTVNGEKMSKSIGNAIDPLHLADTYGVDTLRYFLLREIPFGQDGDFNEPALIARLNNELANELGNLVSRTLAMVDKYFEGVVPEGEVEGELIEQLHVEKIEKALQNYEFHVALSEIWTFVHAVNKYINDYKPWEHEARRADVLYNALEAIKVIAIMIWPFMPTTAEKIFASLGLPRLSWKDVEFGTLEPGTPISKGEILFHKIEVKA